MQRDVAQRWTRATGPSGEVFTQIFRPNATANVAILRGIDPVDPESTAPKNVFGLYTESGTWTLSSLSVCSTVNCATYTGSQLATLFPSLTVKITNPNPPDIKAPVLQGAKITTPTVSLSSGGQLTIEVGVSDNLSGVTQVVAYAALPQTFTYVSAYASVDSTVFRGGLLTLNGTIPSGTATGTYTVNRVFLQDDAGNSSYITDPDQISKLFDGTPTFTLTD